MWISVEVICMPEDEGDNYEWKSSHWPQKAVKRPAFITSPAKASYIIWSQFTVAQISLKTIPTGL